MPWSPELLRPLPRRGERESKLFEPLCDRDELSLLLEPLIPSDWLDSLELLPRMPSLDDEDDEDDDDALRPPSLSDTQVLEPLRLRSCED